VEPLIDDFALLLLEDFDDLDAFASLAAAAAAACA
jgi:hypothetical protein